MKYARSRLMLAPARLLAAILARTTALLGLLGGPLWLAALGTTAAAGYITN